MNTRTRNYRAPVLAILVFAGSPASATIVGRAVALEDLALEVDLVGKATAVADHTVTDEWFEPAAGYIDYFFDMADKDPQTYLL